MRKHDRSPQIDKRGLKRAEALAEVNPSVRVLRAETRLTVYRSPLVRMLILLVGFGWVERPGVKVDVFFSF
jgi:hypothetical protein